MSVFALAQVDWISWLTRRAIWIVLLLLLVIAALASDAFLRPIYLFNVVRQAAPVGCRSAR
jgi:ribose/xylose/arabinose/galactoside ABC-type transport system permease subunit